ncbi:MAG: succinyldiaminopimelate transaminase [Gammaproteobacteria bacterium]|nr:MAG: succinyldiaminopimelate transaminase [Gammaproteobacteria bacterium]
MNPDLEKLHPYPFEKLRALFAGATPPDELQHIALSIGEPKHTSPSFVREALANNLDRLANYPTTQGMLELRQAIADWACRRFSLSALSAETQVLPVNGTREALFAFAQAVIDRTATDPLVVSPNPFYQIYEGAAFLAGAQPWFLPCTAETGFKPDFSTVPAEVWERTQLIYLCSPGNPTGAVINETELKSLIALSDQYDFIIASDECYSEVYFDEQNPPTGLLEVCDKTGRTDYKNCVVFHSLSKRSNLPGLRSGFVAGDARLLEKFLLYRTYHGCSMPIQHQVASIAAWNDETHVKANRDLYREKFAAVLDILGDSLNVTAPQASFYLWPETPIDDKQFARQLFEQQHVTVLPGQYLSRTIDGLNPGANRVRMALVATLDECVEAAERIKTFVAKL